MISRLNETFQIDIPLRWLFELSTIAELSQAIDAAKKEEETRLQKPVITRVAREFVSLPVDPELSQ
jgi:hypothetical protein